MKECRGQIGQFWLLVVVVKLPYVADLGGTGTGCGECLHL